MRLVGLGKTPQIEHYHLANGSSCVAAQAVIHVIGVLDAGDLKVTPNTASLDSMAPVFDASLKARNTEKKMRNRIRETTPGILLRKDGSLPSDLIVGNSAVNNEFAMPGKYFSYFLISSSMLFIVKVTAPWGLYIR